MLALEGFPLSHIGLRYQDFPRKMLDQAKAGERGGSAMDANNRGFLLVLSRNAYFAVDCGQMVFTFPGRVFVAAAASFPGSCVTPSLATSTASLGNPSGAIA
jgi:hypothetical protein